MSFTLREHWIVPFKKMPKWQLSLAQPTRFVHTCEARDRQSKKKKRASRGQKSHVKEIGLNLAAS